MEQPCRPYRIGDHSRAVRNRLLRSMLIAAVVAAIASVAVPIVLGLALPGEIAATAANVAGVVILPLGLILGHWALIGPRRWAALELLIWAGRHEADDLRRATGLRDPTDRAAAAAWIADHPAASDEHVSLTYWRAHLLVLVGDAASARAELTRLHGVEDLAFQRAELMAEIDLAEGKPVDIAGVDAAARLFADPFQRSVAAINVGALAAQVAWTCGRDDVAPVLAQRPLIGDAARGTLLRHYWLPFAVVTVVSMGLLVLVGSLLA